MKKQALILSIFFFCFFYLISPAFSQKTDYEYLTVQFHYDGYNLTIEVCNPEDRVLTFDDPLYLEGVLRTYRFIDLTTKEESIIKTDQGLQQKQKDESYWDPKDPLKKAFDGTYREAYGLSIKTQFHDEDTINLDDSPFHGRGDFQYGSYEVEMKPKSCGTRVIPINVKLEQYEKYNDNDKKLDQFQIIFNLKQLTYKSEKVFESQWLYYKQTE